MSVFEGELWLSFWEWMGHMRPLSRYVLTRCTLLASALLASALVVLVWAGESTLANVRLYWYAGQAQDMALAVLGTGLIGSALLEDILVHNTIS